MTKEEAIEVFKNDIEICTIQQKQACDMAIKALEQQPAEDCVSRKFVEIVISYPQFCVYEEYKGKPYFSIKYTENGQEFIGFGTYKLEVLSEYLRNYFMTPQQTRWIPVSERLPEKDGEYLLYGKVVDENEDNYIFIGLYDEGSEGFGWWEDYYDNETLGFLDSDFTEYASVLAWMPLPEVYKAESEDKDDDI